MCTGPDCACLAGTAEWCGGICTDLTSDPASCGTCGHDCGGSGCFDGLCLPERLAVVPNGPAAIVLDGDDLVFATTSAITSSGVVYRMPKTGGALEVLHRGLGTSAALAVAPGAILVADSGQVGGCRPFSSTGNILAITGDETVLHSMGRRCAQQMLPIDGGLTWVEGVSLGMWGTPDPGAWIARLPDGASPDEAPVELYGRRVHGIRELIHSDSSLIWHEGRSPSILQMPVAGGAASTIASAPDDAVIVAHTADAERLVYVDSRGAVRLRSLVTGTEVTVAQSVGEVRRITMDASFVYWSNEWFDGGGVWAADLRSFERRQLAGGGAGELVQDDRFLYVLRSIDHDDDGFQTEVLRIRKPASIGLSRPGPVECRAPFSECPHDAFAETCVDLATDSKHCGDCTAACGAGEICTGGLCACAATSLTCGGRCVDPATDEANCGRCGRGCAGGECLGGDCTPVKIDDVGLSPGVAQDASAVYYARGYLVRRLDKQSLGVTTLVDLGEFARWLAVDATRLYLINDIGAIWSRAKTGTGSMQFLYYSGNLRDARQLAVVGDAVLWVENVNDIDKAPVKLVHAASNGTGVRGAFLPQLLYPGGENDESRDVAVAGSVVYWLLGNEVERRGAILRIDLAAASPAATVVATLDRDPSALAVAGDRLYVTTRGSDGVLLSLPATGGPVSLHAKGLVNADMIEIFADGGIYWVDGDANDRMVRHLAPGSVAPRVAQMAPGWLGSAPSGFLALLGDANRLYTISYGEGTTADGIFVMTR